MATTESVQKVLSTSPTPLGARTIAELTGSDEARVKAALAELAREDLARRVKHDRWVAGSAPRHSDGPMAPARARR